MKAFIISIALMISVYAVEIAPTNFDLRSLALLVSQECNKNIIVSQDVKNMSVDYFIIQDISPDILFSSFKKSIESKGLFLNDYNDYYLIDEKEYKPIDPANLSNVELTMKVIMRSSKRKAFNQN